tara:strand:- start:86 stop:451 length:366 start_codon:yes stop_codon:yes gene_type:complete
MNVLQSIYNKLKPKTELKTHAVKLNKLTDIKQVMDETLNNLDLAMDAFNDGKEKVNFAKDVLQDENNYQNAADEVTNILFQINDLGIDLPREVEEIDSIMLDIQDRQRTLYNAFDNLGINI